MRTVIRSLLLATLALPLSLHAAISGTPRQVVSDSCGVSDWQTAACQVTLSGASLSANDLIVVMMSRNDDGFTALCPTEGGYTLAQNNGGGTANSVGGAICWKKASGSETTITGGIATGQQGRITAYVFSGTDLDLSSAASNQDNGNGAATTKSSSAASNTEATGLGVAMVATDDGVDNNVTGLTNSWVDLADSGSGSTTAESFAASKVLSSAASQETTATITSDQAWGTILVFNGAPAVSIDGTARQTQTDTCGGSEWETANCRVTLSGGTLSANDLIMVAWSRNDDGNTTPVLPSEGGYTLGDSYSSGYAGTLGCAWAWKKASGSETTITPSWSSIVQPGAIAAAVFPGGGLNLAAPEAKAENETNVAGASASISSGTVSNVTANALGLAAFCADNGANNATAYSNSWNEQAAKDNDVDVAPIWIASKVVSSVASQETVATITSNEAYGAIAFFGGTGGALPETCASGRTPVLITDTSSATDTNNLLYGLGVTANQDTVCIDATTALGKAVTLDPDGYLIFASAGSMATDSVGYTVNDNGAGEGSAGSFEMTFQPVITSVTGIGTGQTTGTVTVTPAGPTEGTVRGVAISKTSYDTYGAPTHAQIAAGVDGNNANVAWGSEFTKSFQTAVGHGWTFSRASTQVGASENGDFHSAASGYPMLLGSAEYVGTIYGDSLANDSSDIGASVGSYGLFDYTIRRQATGGYTLSQIKTVFDGDFPYSGDNFVILEGGINDIVSAGSDPNTAMRSDMAAMADDVIAAGKHLVIVNLMPWKAHANWTSTRQTYTDSYNAWLLATYPEYVFDAASVVEDPATADTLLAAYDSGDGLHPNSTGFAALNTALADEFPKTAGTGILLEGSRTNLALRSTLTGSVGGSPGTPPTGWTFTVGTGTSAEATSIYGAKDGAVAIYQTATAERPILHQTIAVSANTTYTFSIYVESITGTVQVSRIVGASSVPAGTTQTYSIDGVTVASGATCTTGRLAVHYAVAGTSGNIIQRVGLGTDSNATGTLQFSRPQFEAGSVASSFKPTTTAASTRENTSLDRSWNTPTNTFSGYAVVRARVPSTYTAGAQPIITYYKDANNWLKVTHPTTSGRMDLDLSIGGTTASAQVTGLTWAVGDQLDIRWRKNASGIKLWVEASSAETTTGVAPDPFTTPPDTIRLGRSEASVYGNWTVESLKVWNSVDDTALGALN